MPPEYTISSQEEAPGTPLLPGEGDERVNRILESITDGFCAHDAEWRFTFLNEAAKRLVAPHIEPSALMGRVLWEVLPETRGTILEREYLRSVRENKSIEISYYNPLWRRWFSIRGFPIRGGGLSVYFRDITEEKRSAEILKSSEERYRSLFESIDEGFALIEMIYDARHRAVDYRFTEVNPAFSKHTGLVNARGRTARELIPGLEPHWPETYGKIAQTGRGLRFTQGSDAMSRWYDVYAFPVGEGRDRRVGLLFTDITDKLRAEAEMARLNAESSRRLAEIEALLEVIPVGIGIALDRECHDIRLNRAFSRTLGLPLGVNASKTAPEAEQPHSFRVLDDQGNEVPGDQLPMQVAAREGREIRDLELTVEREDGTVTRLLEYAAPLFDEHGKPRGSVGAFIDITERTDIEERQRFIVALDEAMRSLDDPAEIVAAGARLLGEHLRVDRCAYADVEPDEDTFNLTGAYTRGVPNAVGKYAFHLFGTEVLERMRENRPYVTENIETHPGRPEDLSAFRAMQIAAVICAPLHKGGRFAAAMAVHQQVPRRWTAEDVRLTQLVANRCWEALERARVTRILQESEERFRTLADNIAQLAWMADNEGHSFWFNQRWLDYTGASSETMHGRGWEQLVHPDNVQSVAESWRHSLQHGAAWEETFPLRGADGEYRWFLSHAFPIRDANGQVLRWFGTNTDVTEQREAVVALAKAKEEAELANRTKDEFLAALSHELRTPLTPVLLSAGALQEDERLPDDVRSQLAMMRRNIELEARLIDDLLDLTRVANGKLMLRLQICEAHALVRLALEIIRAEADVKRLKLEVALQAERTAVRCDSARLQQVFWNILKNAVKFTPLGGSIRVRSFNEGDRIVVEISDTGIGIAAEALDRIFLPFEQAGLANDHRFGGLGLGLSICRAIMHEHGGEISVASEGPGRGATFRATILCAEPVADGVPLTPGGAEPASPIEPDRPLRLLLVEDHEPTLAVLSRLLRRAGHEVSTAASVQAAKEVASQTTLDGVVSDIGLPDGTGIELMQHLRNQHGLRGIALSGYGMDEDLRRSQEAGFVTHLTKPIDFGQLKRALGLLVQA